MSASLHLNLLNDDERVCSSPVRMRVMLPIFAVLTVIGLCVWWSLLAVRLHNAVQVKHLQEARIADLKPSQEQVLSLRAREGEARAVLEQLRFYRASRLCFSETLLRLPQHVPEAVQLTDVRIPPPPPLPPPPFSPPGLAVKTVPPGPTNLTEAVTLRVAGRAGSSKPSEAVRALLDAFRLPDFTNLVRAAEIPKGAIRQDTARGAAVRDTILFEITCDCGERRFK